MSLSDVYVNKDLINTFLPPHKHRLMNVDVNPFDKFYKSENVMGGKLETKFDIPEDLARFLPPRQPRTQQELLTQLKEYLRGGIGLNQLTQRMAEIIHLNERGMLATNTFREIAETFRGLRRLYD